MGAVALGQPFRGQLLGGQLLEEERERWVLVAPNHAWGTPELLATIRSAVGRVATEFPADRPLRIGDLSRQGGGWLRPHRSHQNGRDADLGFYYLRSQPWYRPATADNLDAARTWSLLEGLLSQGDVQWVLMDRGVQRLLQSYARRSGEDPEWVNQVFEGLDAERCVRHAWGHRTHLHVRVYAQGSSGAPPAGPRGDDSPLGD